jgi:hypothetical protein
MHSFRHSGESRNPVFSSIWKLLDPVFNWVMTFYRIINLDRRMNMRNEKGLLTRRDFIRGTVGTTLSLSILGPGWVTAKERPKQKSLVTVVREKDAMDKALTVDPKILKKMLDQNLLHLTGKKDIKEAWSTLIRPDDIVGLVPTEYFNPTHPEVVDAVKNSLSGVGVPNSNVMDVQGDTQKLKACTALISLPALKAHWLTGIGTVFKNYIMFSGVPSRYHGRHSSKLGEIWQLPHVRGKTRLVLVDALYPLCDKGPQPDPRYKWVYNGLIAGTDPVAVEAVSLRIITEKRNALKGEPWPLNPPSPCLVAADNVYGLGTSRMEEIEIRHYGWRKGSFLP